MINCYVTLKKKRTSVVIKIPVTPVKF